MGNARTFLPSGKFLSIALSLLIVGALIGIASFVPKHENLTYTNPDSSGGSLIIDSLNKVASDTDSDSDNLPDWQENLWGTDPHNPDTDGDLTPDGEEIKEGRDPLKKGPGDKLPSLQAGSSISNTESLTKTDILARQLFSEYTRLKQSGQSISSSTESYLISKVLSEDTSDIAPRLYTEAEIPVISDTSDFALKKYGNDVGKIMKRNPYEVTKQGELTIFQNAVETDNKEEIQRLDIIISNYESIVKDLLKVSVPQSIVKEHLAFVNNLNAVLEGIENMREVFTDSYTALSGLKLYTEARTNLITSLNAIRAVFKAKNIVFSKTEDGISVFDK